jgi:hypothetical protein
MYGSSARKFERGKCYRVAEGDMKYTVTAYVGCWGAHETEQLYEHYAREAGCIDATLLSGIVNDHMRYAFRVTSEFSDKDQATDCFNEFRDLKKKSPEYVWNTHARLYVNKKLVDSFGDMSLFRDLSTGWTYREFL